MSELIVIPARWSSSRFPGKLLADLEGRTVLERVYERCQSVPDGPPVVIATDHDRIEDAAQEFGAHVIRTSADHATGTDRVAEVARSLDAEWYVNVQGDEPFIEPASIASVLEAARSDFEASIVNAKAAIENEAAFRSTTVPKVVTDEEGRLLYMSRAAIPTTKTHAFVSAYRQVGIYAFRAAALRAFAGEGRRGRMEELEDIEILRFLERGFVIRMVEVPESGLAIDTPDDLTAARVLLSSMSQSDR